MRKLIAISAVLLASTAAAAEGYGPAGCGLGSLAFGTQPGFVQVLAATTNGTSYSQTFGITSGTSNCGKSLFALEGTKVFIEGNREALTKDAARGQGETIVALRNIAACQADTQVVGAALQQRFEALFPASSSPEQVRDNLIQFLQSDKSLGCNIG
jgi:ABC-type dipeptide/oligopeptide/nickel transport system ATPase component